MSSSEEGMELFDSLIQILQAGTNLLNKAIVAEDWNAVEMHLRTIDTLCRIALVPLGVRARNDHGN